MEIVKWLRLQWDRAGAWLCFIAGAVTLLVGWIGVSGAAYPAAQLPYIASGGIGGLFLLGLGANFWLSADLRDEWRKLDRIEQAIRELRGGSSSGEGTHLTGGMLGRSMAPNPVTDVQEETPSSPITSSSLSSLSVPQ